MLYSLVQLLELSARQDFVMDIKCCSIGISTCRQVRHSLNTFILQHLRSHV
jgi:hypothetical protein